MAIGRMQLCMLIYLVGLVGCSKSGTHETAPVRGKVTLDGQPVSKGTISFVPQGGKTARGKIGEDGSFTLGTYDSSDGAIVGTHRVVIISQEGEIAEDKTPKYLVPRRYGTPGSSGLSFDVQSGKDNVANFELTTLP